MSQVHDLKLLLLIAMQAEAQPVINKLDLQESKKFDGFPFRVYKGQTLHGHQVTLITSGLDSEFKVDNTATQHAAVMAALGIHQSKPQVVVNAGTAGGFKKSGSKIGDVYLIRDFIYHDRRIPIPGFDKYGVGGYCMELPEGLGTSFRLATATTGNSLDITDDELRVMLELATSGVLVKEMEAAAIAEVCTHSGVPLLSLKSITDVVDGERVTGEEFLSNLHCACLKLQEGISRLLEILTEEIVHEIRLTRNRELIDKVLEINKNR